MSERVRRLELGVHLWNTTYVPPIEPARREALIEKWSGRAAREAKDGEEEEEDRAVPGGRILFMMSSFDRGKSTHHFKGRDKLDFVLMMVDEMREACEAGFSPHVHLIAAWKISEMETFLRDRMFCRRTGQYVPLSMEEHPPSVKYNLAIKHRVYMKTRLEDFDIFIQTEDDMVVTLNHIITYQEDSELLDNRKGPRDGTVVSSNTAVPGFIRIESAGGNAVAGAGSSEVEWLEWEIILSRFRGVNIEGAGTYLTLDPSPVVTKGGNCQAIWMATQGQLRKLSLRKHCRYLDYDESSTGGGSVPFFNGGLQMFGPNCGFDKVFPAGHFESYLIHHASNNKLGLRGESSPGVPIGLLRDYAEQFMRDSEFLMTKKFGEVVEQAVVGGKGSSSSSSSSYSY